VLHPYGDRVLPRPSTAEIASASTDLAGMGDRSSQRFGVDVRLAMIRIMLRRLAANASS